MDKGLFEDFCPRLLYLEGPVALEVAGQASLEVEYMKAGTYLEALLGLKESIDSTFYYEQIRLKKKIRWLFFYNIMGSCFGIRKDDCEVKKLEKNDEHYAQVFPKDIEITAEVRNTEKNEEEIEEVRALQSENKKLLKDIEDREEIIRIQYDLSYEAEKKIALSQNIQVADFSQRDSEKSLRISSLEKSLKKLGEDYTNLFQNSVEIEEFNKLGSKCVTLENDLEMMRNECGKYVELYSKVYYQLEASYNENQVLKSEVQRLEAEKESLLNRNFLKSIDKI